MTQLIGTRYTGRRPIEAARAALDAAGAVLTTRTVTKHVNRVVGTRTMTLQVYQLPTGQLVDVKLHNGVNHIGDPTLRAASIVAAD